MAQFFKRFDVASQITAPGMPSSDMYHVGATVQIPIAQFNDLPSDVVASLTNFFNVSTSDPPTGTSADVPIQCINVGGLGSTPITVTYPGAATFHWDRLNTNGQNILNGDVPVSFSNDGTHLTFINTGTYCVTFLGKWDDANAVPVTVGINLASGDFVARNGTGACSKDTTVCVSRTMRIAANDVLTVLVGNLTNGGAAGALTFTEWLSFLNIDRVGN